MSNKNLKIEKIKEGISSLNLNEDEKSNSYKIIEEWYKEDKAMPELYADLASISEKLKEYLAELGVI